MRMHSTDRGMAMELGELRMETGASRSLAGEATTFAAALRATPRWLFALLGGASLALSAGAFATSVVTNIWWFALPGLVMLRAGLYGGVLALAPRRRSSVPPSADAAALLNRLGQSLTASELTRRLGWEEARTLRVLAHLVRRGRLIEELNLDDGRWTYERAHKQLPNNDTKTAADRLRAIESSKEYV